MREPIHRPAPSQLQLLEGDMEAEIMKRVSMALLLVALAFAACGAGPAAGLTDTAIQPTVLTPPDNQTPVLYPPDAEPGFRGEANVVILVEGVPFAQRWRTVRTVATEFGGWVSSARTGFAEYEGDTYEFGTAVLEIRSEAFDDLLARVQELGRVISTEFSIVPTGGDDTSTVVVTLTESAAPYYSAGAGTASGPDGRVDRALDTAGGVLLTMLSVLIVGGAVLLPVVVLALIAYAVWRIVRRRWPIVELAESETAILDDADPEPADV